jgi:hypothetical protein
MKLTSGQDAYVKANPGKYPSRKAGKVFKHTEMATSFIVTHDEPELLAEAMGSAYIGATPPKKPIQSKTLKLFRKK